MLGKGNYAVVHKTPAAYGIQSPVVKSYYIRSGETDCMKEVWLHRLTNDKFKVEVGRIPSFVMGMPRAMGDLWDAVAGDGHKRVFSKRGFVAIMAPIMGSLSKLHARGIVHMDLKAENILLRGNSTWQQSVLADFGCAMAQFVNDPTDWDHGYLTVPERMPNGDSDTPMAEPSTAGDVYNLSMLALAVSHPRFRTDMKLRNQELHEKLVTVEGDQVTWKSPYAERWEDMCIGAEAVSLFAQALHPHPEQRPNVNQMLKAMKIRVPQSPSVNTYDFASLMLTRDDTLSDIVYKLLIDSMNFHPAAFVIASRMTKLYIAKHGDGQGKLISATALWIADSFTPHREFRFGQYRPHHETMRTIAMQMALEDGILDMAIPPHAVSKDRLKDIVTTECEEVQINWNWQTVVSQCRQMRHPLWIELMEGAAANTL